MSGTHARLTTLWRLTVWLALPASIGGLSFAPGAAFAAEAGSTPGQEADAGQPATEREQRLGEAEQMAAAALAAPEKGQPDEPTPPAPSETPEQIDYLQLLIKGGWLMIPIALMSLLVVAAGAERFLGLRRRKVVPSKLLRDLAAMADRPEGFDPRQAYKLCQRYRCAASRVIQAMLLKVGRPHSELEHAIGQASQREGAALYSNVRWLNLAATVTPLLGLLGTVWGMIQAFFETANLPIGANKAEYLAKGIYVALVTTFAGLSVAIPAAVLAHYFEGRIQKLFRELDETVSNLLHPLERFEGRLRLTKDQLERGDARPLTAAAAKEAATRKPAASRK